MHRFPLLHLSAKMQSDIDSILVYRDAALTPWGYKCARLAAASGRAGRAAAAAPTERAPERISHPRPASSSAPVARSTASFSRDDIIVERRELIEDGLGSGISQNRDICQKEREKTRLGSIAGSCGSSATPLSPFRKATSLMRRR